MTQNDCLRRWKQKRLRDGGCIHCGKKALPNKKFCKKHMRSGVRGGNEK